MKKGKIIQGIKTNTSVSVIVSTLFYIFLASFFIEGGLWIGSELVGPFSQAIGFLAEFFSPGSGTTSVLEFFYHYFLYYELLCFVFILLPFSFLGESYREKSSIKLRLCKKKLAQVSSLGDHDFTCSNGSDRACLPSKWHRVFCVKRAQFRALAFYPRIISILASARGDGRSSDARLASDSDCCKN